MKTIQFWSFSKKTSNFTTEAASKEERLDSISKLHRQNVDISGKKLKNPKLLQKQIARKKVFLIQQLEDFEMRNTCGQHVQQ